MKPAPSIRVSLGINYSRVIDVQATAAARVIRSNIDTATGLELARQLARRTA